MKYKKLLVFMTVVIMIGITAFVMYWSLVRPSNYPVFVESIAHGSVTADGYEKTGKDDSYRIVVKNGDTLTLNIAPEITDSTYYVLDKLLVNGENVESSVSLMKYTTVVKQKMTVLAYFKSADRPENSQTKSKLDMPSGRVTTANSDNAYLGSAGAAGMEDSCIIYDSKSEYFYAFASANKVSRSADLINWESLGCYFRPQTDSSVDESIMDFSQFESVNSWGKTHGYPEDLSYSDPQNNRVPITPEITKIGSTYYLYFAIRKDKSLNEAAIFCVKTDDIEESILTKTWTDVGMIVNSCAKSDENGDTVYDTACAVSPSVFFGKDNLFYMAYGSYYGLEGQIQGSVHLLQLDVTNGSLMKDSAINLSGEQIGKMHGEDAVYSGKLIAAPGRIPSLSKNEGNMISGADVSFNSDTGYYYMFMTYGVKGINEQIRVVRSEDAKGPYVDYNGRAADGTSGSRFDQLDIGLKISAGYTFTSSNTGGVSKNDLGRASTGGVEIVKLSEGWCLAMHSSAFHSNENGVLTAGGEKAGKAALELRTVLWTADGWPIVSSQGFAGEDIQDVPETEMYGIWDVVVFDKRAGEADVNATENNQSFRMSVFSGVAITDKNISDGTKLKSLSLVYDGKNEYTIVINNVEYKVSAIVAYDRELKCNCITFSGVAEDGTTVWAKKSVSSTGGIYSDAFNYILERADSELKKEYTKKFKDLGENPTQSDINTLAAALIEKIKAD